MLRNVLTLALVGLFAVSAPACSKDKSGGGGGGGAKGKPAGAAASALDIFPEDTAIVAGINVKKVLSSKMWEKYGAKLLEEGEVKEGLGKLKDACGMDPTKDIESVVIGLNGDADQDKIVILVKGAFDEAKITKCITGMVEKEEGKKVAAKTDGKITEYSAEGDDKKIYVGWAAADTMVIVPAAMEGDKAALEAIMAGKSSAKKNKDPQALKGNCNTSETIWAAAVLTGKIGEQMAAGGGDDPKPKAIWLNMAYVKDLALEIGARFPNDKDATAMADKANKELEGAKSDPMAGDIAKAVKIAAKGSDVVVNVNMNEKQIDDLVTKIEPMIPFLLMGAMGGGGGGM